MKQHNWRLPDGVDELLPPRAWQLEQLRRGVLDRFDRWGYAYVMPPLIEYLDSLLVGFGNDLELQTFRMVDQRSGRMLGIRADMTSQAARIDANSLKVDGVQRLCYAGTLVHANPEGVLESRVPLIAGAEIFGAASLEADAEVLTLMVDVLEGSGIESPVIELGHVSIFRALAAAAKLNATDEQAVFRALQRKSEPDLETLVGKLGLARKVGGFILALPSLMGGADVLQRARLVLKGAPAAVGRALDDLEFLAAALAERCPSVALRFDLCELTGYGYHTGPVFTAYSPNFGRDVARGGRYDAIGRVYGRARPATGFDLDLKRLPLPAPVATEGATWAPAPGLVANVKRRNQLWARIGELRRNGRRVVCALHADEAAPSDCDRQLVWRSKPTALRAGSTWHEEPIPAKGMGRANASRKRVSPPDREEV